MILFRAASHARLLLRTRMPFRYGIATLSEVTHFVLRATFSIKGRDQDGLAADNLAPKWFKKDPAQPMDEELTEMLTVIRVAVGHAMGITAPTAFAFWRELYDRQVQWAARTGTPPLLAHFGTSLVERAMLDAV